MHLIKFLLCLLFHPSNVIHCQVNPPVYPAEELSVEVGKQTLLLLESRADKKKKKKKRGNGLVFQINVYVVQYNPVCENHLNNLIPKTVKQWTRTYFSVQDW